MSDPVTDEYLDEIARSVIIPALDRVAAIDYPDQRQRGCRLLACTRVGYANGYCQPHYEVR